MKIQKILTIIVILVGIIAIPISIQIVKEMTEERAKKENEKLLRIYMQGYYHGIIDSQNRIKPMQDYRIKKFKEEWWR